METSKEKAGSNIEPTAAEGHMTTSNLEYERYLELHHQFDGPKRKAFLRKCLFYNSSHPLPNDSADFDCSGLEIASHVEFFIPDVFVRQEQRWKCKGKAANRATFSIVLTISSCSASSRTWA